VRAEIPRRTPQADYGPVRQFGSVWLLRVVARETGSEREQRSGRALPTPGRFVGILDITAKS
jgi:hypothetical protein